MTFGEIVTLAVAIGGALASIASVIFTYGRQTEIIAGIIKSTNEKFEEVEEHTAERFAEVEKQFEKFNKWHEDHFSCIKELQILQGAQDQINKSKAESLVRIEAKLAEIEGLLRNRRSSDK